MPAAGLHVVITGDPRGFQAAVAAAGGSLDKFGSTARVVGARGAVAGKALTKGVTLPIVALGAASVNVATKFEQQMSSLEAAANAPAKAMEALRKSAIKAGADTAYSAREAAVAQTELAKGGIATADILRGGLSGALSLAAAGELELGEAASITSDALNLFGMRGGEATSVADAMAAAANSTTADVSDFGMALKMAGSVAKMSGYSFSDTMVSLEALAKAGIKNSDAGTSMKAAMLALLGPSKVQKKMQAELGLSFRDNNGEMKRAGPIADMLRDKLSGMGKAQRIATLKQLAGADGVRYLSALYSAGGKTLSRYEKMLVKSGTAAETARKKQDNFAGKLEQLKGSVETLGITIGTTLIPPLSGLAVKATLLANKLGSAFSGLSEGAKQAGLAGLLIVAALGPVVFIAAKLVTAFSIVGGAFSALAGAVGVATAPFLLVVAAVAAVAYGLYELYRTSESFRTTVQSAVAAVGAAFAGLVATLKPAVASLIAALGPLARALGPVLGFAIKLAVPIIVGGIKAIAQVLKGLVQIVTGVVKLITGIFTGDFGAMWTGVKSIFSGAINAIVGLVRIGLVVGLGRLAGLAIKGVAAAFRAGLGVVTGAATLLFRAPVAIGNAMVGAMRAAGGALVKAVGAALRGGLGLVKSAASAIGSGIIAVLRGFLGAHAAVGAALIRAFVGAVRAAVGLATSAASAVAQAALGGLRAAIGAAAGIGSAIISGLVGGIRSMVGAAASAAADVVRGALNAAKSALRIKSPSKVTHDMGQNFTQGLANGIIARAAAPARAAAKVVKSATVALMYEIEGAIRHAGVQLADLEAKYESMDKAAEKRRLKALAGRRIYGDKKHAAQDDSTKQARRDLAAFNKEASRSKSLSRIRVKIEGLEKVKAFKASIAGLGSQMRDFAAQAAASFKEVGEKLIDSELKGAIAGIDAQLKGAIAGIDAVMHSQLAALAAGAGAELSSLRGAAEAEKRANEDREAQEGIATATGTREKALDTVAAAEEALRRAQLAGNARAVQVMQARLTAAQQAAQAAQTALDQAMVVQTNLERERRMAALEQQISDEQQAIETRASNERAGAEATAAYQRDLAEQISEARKAQLDIDTANFQAALTAQLMAEIGQLEARKQSYAAFARDVQAILASVGLSGMEIGSSEDEAARLAMGAKKPAAKPKKKKKPPKKKRAAGGKVMSRIGEFATVGETGVEKLFLPRGTRVSSRDQTARGEQRPAIGVLNVYPQGTAGNNEQALANWLGFRFATTRR